MPSVAEWIDRILGPALAPLAALLRVAAAVGMLAAVTLAVWRALLSIGAWRYGWEEASVVRCRVCGGITADPDRPACPSGHPVRFPPGAGISAALRRRLAPWRGALALAGGVLALALGAAAVAAWLVAASGSRRLAAAALLTAVASLLASGAAVAALAAISPGRRGLVSRLALLALAAAAVPPALMLGLSGSGLDSPEAKILGAVWSTPTAVYVEGQRGTAQRVGPASTVAEAHVIEVRLPGAGAIWQGLAEIRAGESAASWPGERGLPARVLARIAAAEPAPAAFVRRSSARLPLPVNRKVWVVRRGERISFDARAPGDLPVAP